MDIEIAKNITNLGVRIMTAQVGPLPNNIAILTTPGLNRTYPTGQALLDNGMNDFINVICNGIETI